MRTFILLTLLSVATIQADDNKKVWDYFYNNNFKDAMTEIDRSLTKDSENIKLLSLKESCLNGLKKVKEANKTRVKILSIWNKNHKKNFISANYPINLATYIRIVEVKPSSIVIGSEYFIPYPVNQTKDGYYYHKFTVYNRYSKKPDKFFKLENSKATSGRYKLFEIDSDGTTKEIADYGKTIPDIHKETIADAILSSLSNSFS